jgi:PAS domain S-box-containing protein
MSGTSFLDELKSYIGFTDEDAVTLSEFRPFAAASFPAIADEFYALIRLHEGAFAVLRDEAQARRLHASLQVWLDELLSGPYDEAYVARHGRIGQVHVRVGLPQHYMVTAMSRVRGSLRDLSRRLFSKDPTAEARCGAAIEHICDIDLAIMLESYRRDLDARIARVRALEREATESPRADPTRFLAAVFEVADVAILGFHSEGTLVFWNRKAEALTGYASDEVVGTDPFDRLFAEHAGAMRGQLLSATPTVPVEIEEEMVTRSGRVRRVRWHATAEARAGAASSTVVVVARDVTVERELDRRARQSERLATVGRLAAALAHEIRNPLNGASLYLSVLERALSGDAARSDQAREAIAVLRAELRRLESLVSDFLEVARPRPLMRSEGDLNPLARAVGLLLAPEAEARGIALRVEGFPLPAVGTFDGERIKQALLNLARNALEAVEAGGLVVLRVRRTARSLDRRLLGWAGRMARRLRLLPYPWHWSNHRARPLGGLDRGGARGSGDRSRCRYRRGGTGQRRDSEGQRRTIRGGHPCRKISSCRPRNTRGGESRTLDSSYQGHARSSDLRFRDAMNRRASSRSNT